MSIKIIISHTGSSKAVVLNANTTNIIEIIDKLEKYVIVGSELIVQIINIKTGDFDIYDFEYEQNSMSEPRKWLLNNIIYSITCDKTKTNTKELFENLTNLLFVEYNSI